MEADRYTYKKRQTGRRTEEQSLAVVLFFLDLPFSCCLSIYILHDITNIIIKIVSGHAQAVKIKREAEREKIHKLTLIVHSKSIVCIFDRTHYGPSFNNTISSDC